MNLIYLHGLDSNPAASKAQITKQVATKHGWSVICPDLNVPPSVVLDKVLALLDAQPHSVLIGSSLGGYFANLLSDHAGVPAILLNPSIRPDLSFERFLMDKFSQADCKSKNFDKDCVIYTTTGGWQILYDDLAWFKAHPLQVNWPNKLRVLLKMGDELLDAHLTRQFYASKGVLVDAQDGGDHRISDYDGQVERVLVWAQMLLDAHES